MGFTYFAFISYKREDEAWAKWLQKKLESYGFPVSLRKYNPSLPSKIRPIFRDQSELSGGNLREEIEKGLKESEYLIVICSPRAARSPWVSKEVRYFIDNDRENSIIPFIIGGIPNAKNPEEECFPEGLRQLSGEKEILGININEMGRDAAAIKVIARMFGLRFDTLWQRHERAKRRNRFAVIAGVAAFAIIGFMLAAVMLSLRQDADRQRQKAEEQTLIAEKERDNALKANKSLENANDSIRRQSIVIEQTNRDLAESNRRLAEERDNVLKANRKMMENRAKWVSNEALKLIAEGDVYRGVALTLQVQPENSHEPLVKEIERALRAAQDSLDNGKSALCVFKKHNGCIYSAVSNSTWDYIITGSNDNTVRFWNTVTGEEVVKYRLKDYLYNSDDYMALSNTNGCFVKRVEKSEAENTHLGVWKLDKEGPVFIKDLPVGYLYPKFNDDGSILALEEYDSKESGDSCFRVNRIFFDTRNWKYLYSDSIQKNSKFTHLKNNCFILEDYPILHIRNLESEKTFDIEGRYDGTCNNDSIIMTHLYAEGPTYLSFWDQNGTELIDSRIYLPSDIRSVIEDKGCNNIFIGTGNGEGYMFKNPFKKRLSKWIKLPDGIDAGKESYFANSVDIDPFGALLGKVSPENVHMLSKDKVFKVKLLNDNTIEVTNTINGHVDVIADAHDNRITNLSVVNDKLVSSSFDHTVKVWDLSTGRELTRKIVNGGYYTHGALSNNNKYFATSNGSQIYLYDFSSGFLLEVFDTPDLTGLSFSEDSSDLVYMTKSGIWKRPIYSFDEIMNNFNFLRNYRFSEDEKKDFFL